MEENINPGVPSPVSGEETPMPAVNRGPFGSWWKVGGLVVGILLAAGILYASLKYSQKQSPSVVYPTVTPTPFSAPTPPPPPPITQITPSPTSDETASWKTYVNQINNYSLKIPQDWDVREDSFVGAPGEVSFIPVSEKNKEAYPTIVSVVGTRTETSRYELNMQQQFSEWLTKGVSKGEGERLFKIGNTQIDGLPAVKFVTRTLPGDQTEAFYSIVTWFRKEGINYYIELGGDDETVAKISPVYNQILTTFKFLD